MAQTPTKTPSPGLGVLFLTVFLDLLGFGLVIPLVQPYVKFYWGDSQYVYPIATGLSACYSFAQFLFAPFWGSLSDRIGRRPVFLITIPLTALAYLFFGLASDEKVGLRILGSGERVVYAMFAARTFGGIVSANIGTAYAYVADITTPQNRSKGMGLIGAGFGLGFVVGPALGGLVSHYGRGWPCYLAAALGLINIVWALARLPESLPPEKRSQASRNGRFAALVELCADRRIALLLVLVFLGTFSFSHMEQSIALFFGLSPAAGGRGWTEFEIGLAFGTVGLIGAVVQGGLIRQLSKRFHEKALVLAGWALLVVGFVTTGHFGWGGEPLAILFVAAVLVALGQGISNPSLNAFVSRCAPAQSQGKVFGATLSMNSLARVVGPVSTGWVGYGLGASAPLFVAAAVFALAFLILWTSRIAPPE